LLVVAAVLLAWLPLSSSAVEFSGSNGGDGGVGGVAKKEDVAFQAATAVESQKVKVTWASTARNTWSKHGWRNLKWGMGTQDVRDRVRFFQNYIFDGDPEGFKDDAVACFAGFLPDGLFWKTVEAHFVFMKDAGLQHVEIRMSGTKRKSEDCDGFFLHLRNGLYQKYGYPNPTTGQCFIGETYLQNCEWDTTGSRISLYYDVFPPDHPSGHECDVRLSYTGRAWFEKQVDAIGDPQVTARLKQYLDGL
jgi:hypothetical protein